MTNDSDLDPARIAGAATMIDPVFLNSPQYVDADLNRRLGRNVVVKDETRNPLRSFKGRGADLLMSRIGARRHVVCTSSGNFGHAIAYTATNRGLDCTVFLTTGCNSVAVERIRALGAEVRLVDSEPMLKPLARRFANASFDRVFIEDGDDPAVAEGAGTIGLELLASFRLDTVLVPVGDGALISGVGSAIKWNVPSIRVIGVCAAAAPSMMLSWCRGRPTRSPATTMADGLAIVNPVKSSVRRMRAVVDDVVVVSESALVEAMRVAADALGSLLEPSGAAAIAALLEHDIPGGLVATILTGSLLRPEHLALILKTPPRTLSLSTT